jgi:hypothetical protein
MLGVADAGTADEANGAPRQAVGTHADDVGERIRRGHAVLGCRRD